MKIRCYPTALGKSAVWLLSPIVTVLVHNSSGFRPLGIIYLITLKMRNV